MVTRLFTPGPTPIPPTVQRAMNEPLLYHKSSEFRELMQRVLDNLQYVFCTEQIVLPITCSATGAAEAVVANLHTAGEKILVLNNGRFASRWRDVLELYGITVVSDDIEWGDAPSVEHVSELLSLHGDISAVWIVHSETSTGTVANVKDITKVIRSESDALICVDGVSSVGAMECKMDEWGIDTLICGSQKALMTPPGLGCVALSERAWRRVESRNPTSYYFDLRRLRSAAERNLGVFTPAVGILMGLDAALNLIKNESLEHVIERHAHVARIIRDGVIELGLRLVSRFPADSLTVIEVKNASQIIHKLHEVYGIITAGGQDAFSGKVIRIGHMGYVFERDALYLLECFTDVLKHIGYK